MTFKIFPGFLIDIIFIVVKVQKSTGDIIKLVHPLVVAQLNLFESTTIYIVRKTKPNNKSFQSMKRV